MKKKTLGLILTYICINILLAFMFVPEVTIIRDVYMAALSFHFHF